MVYSELRCPLSGKGAGHVSGALPAFVAVTSPDTRRRALSIAGIQVVAGTRALPRDDGAHPTPLPPHPTPLPRALPLAYGSGAG